MNFRRELQTAVERTPVVGDAVLAGLVFHRRATAVRGVYDSYEEALEQASRYKNFGYDQPIISECDDPAKLTVHYDIGDFDQRDYPIIFHLSKILRPDTTVFNLGGNVGVEFYAYRKFIDYPEGLLWTVCEVSKMVEAGRRIASERGDIGLEFTTDFGKCSGSDILLTCGTIQYLEHELSEMIGGLASKPRHVLINKSPMYDGPSYFTLQNTGFAICPYKIQNRAKLVETMQELGYQVVDSWQYPREVRVPFHSERRVEAYQGIYFALR